MKKKLAPGGEARAQGLLYGAPARVEYALLGVIAGALWLLFAHPDLYETARHSYILLRSIGNGEFFNFYENVYTLKYGYVYSNAAHYGIVIYLLYAVWELPLLLLERLTGVALSDMALALWCKAIGIAAALGCAVLLRETGRQLGLDKDYCHWLPMLFCLNPVTLVTVFAMGQYDSLCLLFMLLALYYYFKKDLLRFSLLMGVALVFKFFALFAFLPLLLLAEKRIPRLAAYAAAGTWLYLPTTLLFLGRTADAGFFNQLMADRLFTTELPGGIDGTSAFGLIMALLCVTAWLYRPADDAAQRQAALYICLAAFTALFALVLWHPQWVLLLIPFLLLSLGTVQDKTVFAALELVFTAGFLLLTAFHYPHQLEGNLLDMGLLQPWLGYAYSTAENIRGNAFYFALVPYLDRFAPLAFHGALLCGTLLKLPLNGRTLADRLSGSLPGQRFSCRLYAWGLWQICFAGFWLVPSLFSYGKTVGLL